MVSKKHDGKIVPVVHDQRNCRGLFTMNRGLEKIQKSESKVRILLGHTVLRINPTILHDVNT